MASSRRKVSTYASRGSAKAAGVALGSIEISLVAVATGRSIVPERSIGAICNRILENVGRPISRVAAGTAFAVGADVTDEAGTGFAGSTA